MYLTLISCIAISGLGSHAFGSWKDRNSHYIWLRDALPYELPGARVLTYGYDTRLSGSHSFQNLEDVASKFRVSLRIALGNRPPDRPLVFIAHSLGGLVLKQALIQMESGDAVDIRNFRSTYGRSSKYVGLRSFKLAALNVHLGVVKTLIKVVFKHTKLTPEAFLILLASKSEKLAVKTLLDAGVMIDAPDHGGRTALMIAVKEGCEGMARMLLEKGANARAVDGHGNTALHYAAENLNSSELVDLLLDAGADPLAHNAQYELALYLIPSGRNHQTALRLLQA